MGDEERRKQKKRNRMLMCVRFIWQSVAVDVCIARDREEVTYLCVHTKRLELNPMSSAATAANNKINDSVNDDLIPTAHLPLCMHRGNSVLSPSLYVSTPGPFTLMHNVPSIWLINKMISHDRATLTAHKMQCKFRSPQLSVSFRSIRQQKKK